MTTFLTPWCGSPTRRSRAFYEALGFSSPARWTIVRDGEKEATNYFFSLPGSDNVLELTFNHDGRTTTTAPATATSRSASTISTAPWAARGQGIEPERPPYTVSDGGSRLCFVRDPDDYRIELIERPNY